METDEWRRILMTWLCFVTACQSSTRRTLRISGMLSFISGFLLLSSYLKSNKHPKRYTGTKERTSSRPLFVPLVPSFLAPALVLTLSLTPVFLGLILAEETPPWAPLGTLVCWSDFCKATFVSVIFRRRLAGTHSSHLDLNVKTESWREEDR